MRLALRYALHRDPNSPVLVGFRDENQIEVNLTCLGEPLTEEEITLLQALTESAARVVDAVRADRPCPAPVTA